MGVVVTDARYRRRGLAALCLRALEGEARRRKLRFLLFPGAGPLCERYGACEVPPGEGWRIRPSERNTSQRIRVACERDVPLLARLACCEPVCVFRTEEDFAGLLSAKADCNAECFVLVVEREGAVRSYAVLSPFLLQDGAAAEAPLVLSEYGGEREALWEACPAVAAKVGGDFLLSVRDEDRPLWLSRCTSARTPPLSLSGGAAVKVIDPRGLWEDVAGTGTPWPPEDACRQRDLASWSAWFFAERAGLPRRRLCGGFSLPLPLFPLTESLLLCRCGA